MARTEDLSLSLRLFLRAYRWRTVDPVPWTRLGRPLADCRVGIVTSAGFVGPGQEPFDESFKGGDPSYRVLDGELAATELREFHRSESFDHSGLEEDPELVYPRDCLRELAEEGKIGSVAPRHLSFMGSITAPGRLVRRTAPEAAEVFVEDEVDVALLVPV